MYFWLTNLVNQLNVVRLNRTKMVRITYKEGGEEYITPTLLTTDLMVERGYALSDSEIEVPDFGEEEEEW